MMTISQQQIFLIQLTNQIKQTKMKKVIIKQFSKENLGGRDTVRENAKRSSEETVLIALDKVVIRKGFNVRQDMGDLSLLAASILHNGQTVAGRVDVLQDGSFVLSDGHRRYLACLLLEKEGHEVFFKAIVNGKTTTEEQRILQMFTTQDNKPLEPHEVAELIKRLINLGHQQNEVAIKIGKTDAYVSQMLSFANETPTVKRAVQEGKLTVSAALKIKKEIPDDTERSAAVSNAITRKNVEREESGQPQVERRLKVDEVVAPTREKATKTKADKCLQEIISQIDIAKSDEGTLLFILQKYI